MADPTSSQAPMPPTSTTGTLQSTAPDATANPAAASGPDMMSLLPLVAIFAIFYFLIIRPQQARMKQHTTMMNALKKGDRVVTGGGIIGTVAAAPEGNAEVTVDLNDTTRVVVLRSTITTVINPEAANDDGAQKTKSQKSEKSA